MPQHELDQLDSVLRAAGLPLSPERIAALRPAAERLRQAAKWVEQHDQELAEPAFIFDAQESGA